MSDVIGHRTLQHLSRAKSFNRWLIEKIEPHLQEPILEIGAGIGNLTEVLAEKKYKTTATDINPDYIEVLSKKFSIPASTITINKLDLNQFDSSVLPKYKTILLVNVIEHVADYKMALLNISALLDKNGKIIVLVPAYKWLYNPLDKNLGHHKRYDKREITEELKNQGFKIIKTQSFNVMGILGWFFWGSLLRKKQLSQSVINAYEKTMPINRMAERLFKSKIGLSIITIAQKKC